MDKIGELEDDNHVEERREVDAEGYIRVREGVIPDLCSKSGSRLPSPSSKFNDQLSLIAFFNPRLDASRDPVSSSNEYIPGIRTR